MRDGTVIMTPETIMEVPAVIKETRYETKYVEHKGLSTGLLILRLTVGGLMLFHGIAKIMSGVDMMKPMLVAHGLPDWLIYGVYIAEVVAPVMIILGLWTRLAAATIVFDMIVAIALVHAGDIFSLSRGGAWAIELEMFYLLTALSLCFTGAGRYIAKKHHTKWD